MATVGNLFINVKARTASFGKKMQGVRATVTRMAKGFGRLAMKVGKFAAILGGVALVAIVALTVKGLKAVDTMAKLAQNIGTSVKSIQVLRHMATLGGVSIEKMDKSIAKMVKNVGESAMGIGTATDALKELGLNATDLERMSPEVMFGVLADEINKLPTAARRASVAYDIMGRAGQELLVTMRDGSGGITAMTEKLESLGVIIGDKQAQMGETANDAWADIGLVWQGLQNQLAVEFAPILIAIANRIIEFVKDAGGMGKIAEFIVKAFFYAGAAGLDVIRAVHIGFLGLKTAILEAASIIAIGMSWAFQKVAEGMAVLEGIAIRSAGVIATAYGAASGFIADVAEGLGADTVSRFVRISGQISTGIGKAAVVATQGSWTDNIQSDMADFLKDISVSLGDQAAETGLELLNKLAEGWNLGKVETIFEGLKQKFMGEGFDISDGLDINLKGEGLKGVVASLQTAIGGFKISGDDQERLQRRILNVEEAQLKTSKEILTAVRNDGSVPLQ